MGSIQRLFIVCFITFFLHASEAADLNASKKSFILGQFNNIFIPSDASGNSKKNILEQFGKPKNITTTIQQSSRESGVFGEISGWQYPGLNITFTTTLVGKKLDPYVTKIILANKDIGLSNNLKVGDHKSAFTKILGEPYAIKQQALIYGAQDFIEIDDVTYQVIVGMVLKISNNGAVESITWHTESD